MRNGEIFLFLLLGGMETQLSKTELSSQLCASSDLHLNTSRCHFAMYEIRKRSKQQQTFPLDVFYL